MNDSSIPPKERRLGARLLNGFQKFSRSIVRSSGHPLAFAIAIVTIVLWALTMPLFQSGNTWLLVINTVTNIVTFLMIFLIRSAQNREGEAVQIKLDELIRATKEAQNTLLDIEELSEEELDRIKTRFERLAKAAREKSGAGRVGIILSENPLTAATPPFKSSITANVLVKPHEQL